MTEFICYIYTFHHTILLNTDVPNCYITLEFITIRLRHGVCMHVFVMTDSTHCI